MALPRESLQRLEWEMNRYQRESRQMNTSELVQRVSWKTSGIVSDEFKAWAAELDKRVPTTKEREGSVDKRMAGLW